ncbi:MAG: hypothetical protein ACLR6T_04690 [Intestinibacter sp.]
MNKGKIHKFRRKLGWIVFLGGMVANVIISWGFLFMKPVFHLLFSIAAGAFSGKLLAISLLKFFLAPIVWYALLWIIEVILEYLGDY